MQRVATVFRARHRHFRSHAAGSVVACALGASILLAPAASAQDATPPASTEASPVASPISERAAAAVTNLFSYQLDPFPTSPVSVRLLRITLAPGAASPMHTHPGPEFDLVESGTLTVTSTGEADVSRGGGEPVTGELAGEQLGTGDLVVFPGGVGMNPVNESDTEVEILSAVFHPVSQDVPTTEYTDGVPASDAFDGVSFVVLGDGIVQSFPDGATTVSLESVAVPAGSDLPGSAGSSLYSLVDGDFAFSVQGGDVQVSRTASPGLRPVAAPQQEFTLAVSDAAFFPNGVVAATRADQNADLSVLRLTAEPATALAETPAELAFITPDPEAVADPNAFTEIGIGAAVVTNTDSINLRAEPTIGAEAIDQLGAGVELTVIGGPEDADDFTWWQVQVTGSEGPVQGWLAADFITLAGAEAPVAETAEEPVAVAESTPAAGTPEATAGGTFATGDVVALTDDNVRVRGEASINSEPIDVFAVGTEFEITGEAVDADEFTWYPVTLVADDTVSGFVAVDFLEPAAAE
ncbi:MAG: SH3 domain-containing protein [Chloroflexia bacterium]|nr:SH3 domain-containing protein [Chloroflexia bacterium]